MPRTEVTGMVTMSEAEKANDLLKQKMLEDPFLKEKLSEAQQDGSSQTVMTLTNVENFRNMRWPLAPSLDQLQLLVDQSSDAVGWLKEIATLCQSCAGNYKTTRAALQKHIDDETKKQQEEEERIRKQDERSGA